MNKRAHEKQTTQTHEKQPLLIRTGVKAGRRPLYVYV